MSYSREYATVEATFDAVPSEGKPFNSLTVTNCSNSVLRHSASVVAIESIAMTLNGFESCLSVRPDREPLVPLEYLPSL